VPSLCLLVEELPTAGSRLPDRIVLRAAAAMEGVCLLVAVLQPIHRALFMLHVQGRSQPAAGRGGSPHGHRLAVHGTRRLASGQRSRPQGLTRLEAHS